MRVSAEGEEGTKVRRAAFLQLFAASSVVLFQELAFIRWLPVQVRATAYFPNVVLIGAFLGLGIGCLRSGRRNLLGWWPVTVALVVMAAVVLRNVAFTQESASEHLWLLYYDLPRNAAVVRSVRLPILLFFVLAAAAFVPLGQFVAERLAVFRDTSSPLRGYIADLAGSLAGITLFTFLSFAGTWPVVWFACFLSVGLLLYRGLSARLAHVALSALILVLIGANERAEYYSPYYAISIERPNAGILHVLTNGSSHQIAAPLRRGDSPTGYADLPQMQFSYHIPYRRLDRPVRRVLVLGAGTGNDVAVALDEGARHVDAVEIDPVILRIGKEHPDHPYADPRVRTINSDARAFLNNSRDKYDLVVFGTLDSQTRLSALSSVRLDNYVYTTECLQAVRRHLTADGGVAMYFWASRIFIIRHIQGMIVAGLGEEPLVIARFFPTFNTIFLAGPAYRHVSHSRPMTGPEIDRVTAAVEVPTDDWPYLYLASRGVSFFYLSLLAAIAVIAVLSVLGASPEMRRSMRGGYFDAEMFLFGLAFLLVETRLVTEMNLIWGATWLTSAVVFGSIVAMILCATILMDRAPIRWNIAAAGVAAALFLTWLIPARLMIGIPVPFRLMASILFIGLPVFFASCCFALLFRERERPDLAFGWNMIGAVMGGLLEFSSMAIGIKATTLLALAAYLAAIAVRGRTQRKSVGVSSAAG